MVTYEPRVNLNGRYSTDEAAALLGVHRNTIIRYTKKGKLRFGIRRSTTRKYYTGAEILRFWKATL